MWEKGFRVVTFAAIYNAIYWYDNELDSVLDINSIAESYEVEITDDEITKITQLVGEFKINRDTSYTTIEQYTTDWNKTYDLVKAIMCTALLELEPIKDQTTPEQKKKIINKYVQIAQEMIGGKNPNLVFAIVGKIYGI